MTILDPDNPEHRLRWPKAVVADEVDRLLRSASTARMQRAGWRWTQSVERLLRHGFDGTELADEFTAISGGSWGFEERLDRDQVQWLQVLGEELTNARAAKPAPPFWSQRKGAQPERLEFPAVLERVVSSVLQLDEREGLWAEAFGVDCPDGVCDPAVPASGQIEDLLGRALPGGTTWPPRIRDADQWTPDDLYDLIEVLHDLSSWPGTWSAHDYGGCPGHPGEFSSACGRALYRHEVNRVLARSNLGVALADAGEDTGRIVLAQSPELAELLDEGASAAPSGFEQDVRHAVALFRGRGRDVAAMRSAIVALAGVLERYRALLKEELLTKDEGTLFQLANEFDIRHRKADQRTDFDPAFLQWIFHWYLATVSLVRDLIAEQREAVVEGTDSRADDEPF